VSGQAAAWDAIASQLDSLWQGQDWDGVIRVLDTYLAQFPDDPIARDKLYAARVNKAGELLSKGDTSGAVAQLEIARELVAGGPADATLAGLTVTPTETPTPGAGVQLHLVQTGGTPLPALEVQQPSH
jgi:hypothetical protein